jgi:hypothetical protein
LPDHGQLEVDGSHLSNHIHTLHIIVGGGGSKGMKKWGRIKGSNTKEEEKARRQKEWRTGRNEELEKEKERKRQRIKKKE